MQHLDTHFLFIYSSLKLQFINKSIFDCGFDNFLQLMYQSYFFHHKETWNAEKTKLLARIKQLEIERKEAEERCKDLLVRDFIEPFLSLCPLNLLPYNSYTKRTSFMCRLFENFNYKNNFFSIFRCCFCLTFSPLLRSVYIFHSFREQVIPLKLKQPLGGLSMMCKYLYNICRFLST